MSEVGQVLALLAKKRALRFHPSFVITSQNETLTPEDVALHLSTSNDLTRGIFEALAQLTGEGSTVMSMVAEDMGLEDFFQASMAYMGEEGMVLHLYNMRGEFVAYPFPLEDFESLLSHASHRSV